MNPKINRPFSGNYPVSQEFGEALPWYVKIAGYPHNGIDYPMLVGTGIYPCSPGTVSFADNVPDSNGLGINITHEWGMSQYWHLSNLYVHTGDIIIPNGLIGLSGNSGWSTGPHLHFGIKVTGQGAEGMRGWSDPEKYYCDIIQAPVVPVITPRTYLVLPGDTLWKIADKIYKNGIWWRKIFDANRDKISDPNKIYPMQILRLP